MFRAGFSSMGDTGKVKIDYNALHMYDESCVWIKDDELEGRNRWERKEESYIIYQPKIRGMFGCDDNTYIEGEFFYFIKATYTLETKK